MSARARKRLVLLGWGAINRRAWGLLAARGAAVDLVGVAVRDAAKAEVPDSVQVITDPADLAALRPDIVVEAAGRAALEGWARAALASCPRLICASSSAFCDDDFTARMIALAEESGGQIVLTPGAIGAVDAMRAASVLPVTRVRHIIRKPPEAWTGTPAADAVDLAITGEAVIFTGTAREAASLYPKNANSTATTALAGIGLDRTEVEMRVDPAATRNSHEIELDGAAGLVRIMLENAPSASNPKSSELTALSMVRLIENEVAPLVI